MTSISLDTVPKEMKQLRACLLCSLVKVIYRNNVNILICFYYRPLWAVNFFYEIFNNSLYYRFGDI